MDVKIESSWKTRLQTEFEKPYFSSLVEFVKGEYASKKIFPPAGQIFNAFDRCTFDNVKVVILGQDPYHDDGQANGLCFSVADGIKQPPSLVNIFKEIEGDLGIPRPTSGNLERWADQGVLLLNATLTVEAHKAGSHQKKGWEEFTDAVIKKVSEEQEGVVFFLWGSYAQKKGKVIDTNKHLVLKSVHPSPLSAHRGFFGNQQFSKANHYLKEQGKSPINW
ncbi:MULTISPECIES: uracil-DNA glycosylase [Flammeovirga]|uniref:Uracil-DNA glycosylase n=1 Tax=Flammeovirga agarivorans TaxID=2726742 RepID=A0A7X8XV47_9BACT|nr:MULTISPECIES: uracil-DNA glycosylase [Flammeovirga]NLR90874.1 uracil-DNA glycosylase [Flammeovirga agarivorans]